MQTTFGIIKPDAVAAGHAGEIITMIEDRDLTLKIDRLEQRWITPIYAEALYAEHKGKFFYESLIAFTVSGPSVLLALKGDNAVTDWRELMGSTNSAKAAAGTIRAMFGCFDPTKMYRNAVHGSDSPEAARRELELFGMVTS